jgi:glutaredoxin
MQYILSWYRALQRVKYFRDFLALDQMSDAKNKEQLLESVPIARSVPQIFIDNQLIGGFTELQKYLKEANGV